MNTPSKSELLAPAGNLSCALAAFDAGADAVYCGLKKFNARERTENFSPEEMSKLIAYARKNGKKVYVTFNTLVKESELDDAAKAITELDALRPDAVIVQDLGIVRMIREYFPGLVIHGSTQMGLNNSAGLSLAHELGLSRVILERQTTLGELDKIMKTKPEVEVEIFIHGALCCCISGSCLLSSWLGGWSGNRGKCKQPCRRRWHGDEGNGFFLSSQDLCTIEIIPDLMKLGVSAFKIEGRLRRPDYVSNVVSAYRMAMDAPDEKAFAEILPAAKERLSHTCGRKWSLGYYTERSAKELIKFDNMGVSGLLCGKVTGFARNGFRFETFRRVYLGDTIRVQPQSGDEGPALCITKMSVNDRPAKSAGKGEKAFIFADKEIPHGGLVYKISERSPDYAERIEKLPQRKSVLDLDVRLSRTELSVRSGNFSWTKKLDLSEAEKCPLSAEKTAGEFRSLNFGNFSVEHVALEIEGKPFLPASVFKALRAELRDALEENLLPEEKTFRPEKNLERFLKDHASFRKGAFSEKVPDSVLVPRGKKYHLPQDARIVREYPDLPSPHEELLLPFFVNEPMLPELRKALRNFAEHGGSVVRISSLHHLALLKEYPHFRVIAMMPLPVCNSMAVLELEKLGVGRVQAWIELEKAEIIHLIEKSPLPVEIYAKGRPVLLSTRASVAAGEHISDMRGEENFRLSKLGALTQILPDHVLELPRVKGAAACFYDFRHASPEEKASARFNFDHTLE